MSSDSFVIDSFNYNGNFLITVIENNIPWFCRNDLARCVKSISKHYWDIYTEAKNKKKFQIKANAVPFNFINEEAVRNILSGKYTNLLIDPNFIPWLESKVLPNLKINTNNNKFALNENNINNNVALSSNSTSPVLSSEPDFSKFEFSSDDVYSENGMLYFKLSRIGEILNISSEALRKIRTNADWIDSDEIKVFDPRKTFPCSINSSTYVSESCFYQIIDHTNSPVAKPFRRYFIKVILPSYRTKVLQNNNNGIFIPNFNDPIEAAKAWLGLAENNKLKDEKIKKTEQEKEIAIKEKNIAIEEKNIAIDAKNTIAKENNKLVTENQELYDKLGMKSNFKAVRSLRDKAKDFFDVTIDKFYAALGKCLAKRSREKNIPVKQVPSSTYGKVNAYFIDVINEFFDDVKKDKSILKEFRLKKRMIKGKLF